MKSTVNFVCQECGYESAQWLGKCPECGAWNSLKEFHTGPRGEGRGERGEGGQRGLDPKKIDDVIYEEKTRIKTGFSEMDGVLGGGIVLGSVILLAGDPGIGKSTLILQTALNVSGALRSPSQLDDSLSLMNKSTRGPVAGFLPASAPASLMRSNAVRAVESLSTPATPRSSVGVIPSSVPISSVLYISGEESEQQIKLRAQRINKDKNSNLLLLSATDTDAILEVIREVKPTLVVIDSIQTIESENLEGLAGSVGQVRYGAFSFIKLAKLLNIPVIIIGHVTKEGMVAGPMILSHMVDVVLFLEGEKNTGTRILRSLKNRFGPIDEVGIFAMEQEGMKEIKNPESLFLNGNEKRKVPGSILVSTIEGTRVFLVELQALVVFSKLPMPRRVVSGIDGRRVELLLAVLQKHCNLPLNTMDVFVNVAGGIKISDPAIDLGICLAIFSSFKNIPLSGTVGIAEVGLLGELRKVPLVEKRIKEAKKLGYKNVITSNDYKTLGEVVKSLQ
ncbi:DNA repair protein RadA [Patescibacteria group bacterium]|nr:DNA repair protein RadA [Patescibacteria group bacterium]